MEKLFTTIRFIKEDGTLIYQSQKINPLQLISHDYDVMSKLLYPEDFGFAPSEGIICEDWVIEHHIQSFLYVILGIYSWQGRRTTPELYRNDKLIVSGEKLLSTILICNMLGLNTELDVFHNGIACTEETALLSMKQNIMVPRLYSQRAMIIYAPDMIEVPNIRNYSIHLVGLWLAGMHSMILTAELICVAHIVLSDYEDYESRGWKERLAGELRQIIQTGQYLVKHFELNPRLLSAVEQLSGMKIDMNNKFDTTNYHIEQALFHKQEYRSKMMQNQQFVRYHISKYYLSAIEIPCSYEAWKIAHYIRFSLVEYHTILNRQNAYTIIWGHSTQENLEKASGVKYVFSQESLRDITLRQNPMLLLLVGIITKRNTKYINCRDYEHHYGYIRTTSQFIEWEKELLEEYIDATPPFLHDTVEIDLIKAVMQQM